MTTQYFSCCVYFIGAKRESSPVKIGISECPEIRLVDLQIASPYELLILTQFVGGEETEEKLHKLFWYEHLRGEWFRRSDRIKTFIQMMNCKVGLTTAIDHAAQHMKELESQWRTP